MGTSYNLADPNIHTVPAAPLDDLDYNQRILPRQLSSGALRGTQNVGYGDVKIDGSNEQIIIGNVKDSNGEQAVTVIGDLTPNDLADKSFGFKVTDADGAQILLGRLSDGSLGMQLLDASGNEVMRTGYLPLSGIYGWATATPGNSLEGQV